MAGDIGDKTIDSKQAISIARRYLEGLGIESMRETYYEIANNICTINFAYQQDGVVCYTDLIKVGVAMDNGDIVSLDTRGYIVNHQSRQIPAPALTREEAMEKVSKNLSVQSAQLAVIPLRALTRAFVYEFKDHRQKQGACPLLYQRLKWGGGADPHPHRDRKQGC